MSLLAAIGWIYTISTALTLAYAVYFLIKERAEESKMKGIN